MFETTQASVDIGLTARNIEAMRTFYIGVPGRKLVFFKDPDGNLIELNWIDPAAA